MSGRSRAATMAGSRPALPRSIATSRSTICEPELRAARIDATVLVQAAPTVAETEYLLDVARSSGGVVRGVVGWVDLGATDAIATLERLARDPLLKSIRPMLHDLAGRRLDPASCGHRRIARAAGARSALRRARAPARVARAAATARAAAGAGRRDRPRCQTGRSRRAPGSRGRDLIETAATHPRVCCKLSGLVTEAESGLDAGLAPSLRRAPDRVLRPAAIAVGERLAGGQSRRRLREMGGDDRRAACTVDRGGARGDSRGECASLLRA